MGSFEFNLADGFDVHEYFGSLKLPPQKMILALPYGTKVELVNESQLREQIAREIMDKCKNEKETNTSEFGSYEVVGCLEFIQLEDTAYYEVTCTHAKDAAIARGK